MFNLDLLSFSGTTRPGIFDAQPMRRILAELIDFDRLNAGGVRVSIVTVDLACGEEVVFDTATSSINLDHIMASAALIPNFPPVEINGRLYVDGGFIANLPAHIVLDEARAQAEHMTCFVVDLFPSHAPLPLGLLQAAQRQTDLLFACQSVRMFADAVESWEDIERGADVYQLCYQAFNEETPLKGFDFSAGSLARRYAQGAQDACRQINQFRSATTSAKGLTLHVLSAKHPRSTEKNEAARSIDLTARQQ